jgi:sigma-B regulation protein RsbU (phosphoserine phosphatase)
LNGVPLGSFPGITYEERVIALEPGDLFVFYTDGVSEASNEDGLDFGRQRLCEVVSAHRTQTPREIVDAIFDEVAEFRGVAAQADDMTAVAVRFTG